MVFRKSARVLRDTLARISNLGTPALLTQGAVEALPLAVAHPLEVAVAHLAQAGAPRLPLAERHRLRQAKVHSLAGSPLREILPAATPGMLTTSTLMKAATHVMRNTLTTRR